MPIALETQAKLAANTSGLVFRGEAAGQKNQIGNFSVEKLTHRQMGEEVKVSCSCCQVKNVKVPQTTGSCSENRTKVSSNTIFVS
jgi:hypothetical protein